jgi:hypothetical protein
MKPDGFTPVDLSDIIPIKKMKKVVKIFAI